MKKTAIMFSKAKIMRKPITANTRWNFKRQPLTFRQASSHNNSAVISQALRLTKLKLAQFKNQ